MKINQISTFNYNSNSRKQVNFKNARNSLLTELKASVFKEKNKLLANRHLEELGGYADDFAEYLERLCM